MPVPTTMACRQATVWEGCSYVREHIGAVATPECVPEIAAHRGIDRARATRHGKVVRHHVEDAHGFESLD